MQEPILRNVDIPSDELPDDGQCVLLCQLLALLEEVLEVALVAELGDDVAIIGGAEDVVALEDVGVAEFLERLDLALEHLLLGLALDGADVDDLDGYFFLGLVVGAAVDHRAETAADDVPEAVGVVLDFLAHVVAGVQQLVHSNSI